MKIPFLGMEWCRQTDTIRFNGSFSIKKKNRLGQNKLEDISSIDKKLFKDLHWLRSHISKRVILRFTMCHYDPLGRF